MTIYCGTTPTGTEESHCSPDKRQPWQHESPKGVKKESFCGPVPFRLCLEIVVLSKLKDCGILELEEIIRSSSPTSSPGILSKISLAGCAKTFEDWGFPAEEVSGA